MKEARSLLFSTRPPDAGRPIEVAARTRFGGAANIHGCQ